jgi:chaperonin cofactor prefoldin
MIQKTEEIRTVEDRIEILKNRVAVLEKALEAANRKLNSWEHPGKHNNEKSA